jgi:hypothetical protein
VRRRPERRQELVDHRAAESRLEQLLNLDDEGEMLWGVDPLATRRSLGIKESLLLVVAERPDADSALGRELTDSHISILAHPPCP